ncbi:MAG: methenyltetrahydromethanopterin cyclohydrolase [Candidatus Bathyarchaeia archaeon]
MSSDEEEQISVNNSAMPFVEELIAKSERLAVDVTLGVGGSVIVDAGVKAKGSYEAGRLVTLACMGGLGEASISIRSFNGYTLPTITVETSHPVESLLASQFAGWRIKTEDYFAMGSGPARALSLDPKELYEEIGYRDQSEKAVLVLESSKLPTDQALKYIAEKCKVNLKNLYVVVAKTSSIVGSVQISGRIVETGLHRLKTLSLNPKSVVHGIGSAPIAPIHPDDFKAMGRTNDVITYAGEVFFTVNMEDDERLCELVKSAPSSSSKDYGKPFYEVFKAADYDFYKVDPGFFAPAFIAVNNLSSGATHSAGEVNWSVLRRSLQYTRFKPWT